MKRSVSSIITLALLLAVPARAAEKRAPGKKAPASAKAPPKAEAKADAKAEPRTDAKDAPKTEAKADNTVSQADVDQYLAFFDRFVGVMASDQDDCDKMAKDMGALLDANRAILMKAKAAQDAGKTLPEDARDHMVSAATKVGPGVMKCASNPKIAAVLQKIPR